METAPTYVPETTRQLAYVSAASLKRINEWIADFPQHQVFSIETLDRSRDGGQSMLFRIWYWQDTPAI